MRRAPPAERVIFARAEVTGGSGAVLSYRWSVAGRTAGYEAALAVRRSTPVSVTDSTGTSASATSPGA